MKEIPPTHSCSWRAIRGSFFLIGLLMLWAGTGFAQTQPQQTLPETGETQVITEPVIYPTPRPLPTPIATPIATPMPTATPIATPTPVPTATPVPAPTPIPGAIPVCSNTITARVVAFDQVITYNRFGAFNPHGMMYALQRDVVGSTPGGVSLRGNKRPRPIVLRVNEGDCLSIIFTNYLSPTRPLDPDGSENSDTTKTRYASIHVNGLDYLNIASDGANVGKNVSSLAAPGESKTYSLYAKKQGQYLMYSMAAPAGGEGDNGQPGLGLFGSVNVEPKNSKWYRSQVTAAQLQAATTGQTAKGTPILDYEKLDATNTPILNMLSGNEIVHSDINAIITGANGAALEEDCTKAPPTGTCGQPFPRVHGDLPRRDQGRSGVP